MLFKKFRRPPPVELPKIGKKKLALVLNEEGHPSGWLQIRKRRRKMAGRQAKATALVKAFAKKFPGKNLETIKNMMKALREFKKVPLSPAVMEKFYARRTAEDIIGTKTIAMLGARERKMTGMEVLGCNDYCLALIGLLKAKGIKAEYLWEQKKHHSRVIFYLNKQPFLADPTVHLTRQPMLTPLKAKEFKAYLKGLGEGARRGKDMWDAGLFSLEDAWGDVWKKEEGQK